MAYNNRNQQGGRASSSPRDDMPAERKPTQSASLDYPEIAQEYDIDKALWLGLQNLYPGAQANSIVMVYEYCKVRHLDPLKKPVHIVPMSVKDAVTGAYIMRDVIMPGIQEMRTTASRTNQYAGIDPPKFGPLIEVEVQNKGEAQYRGKFVSVPEWCEITVYKLVQGKRYAFTHIEYFEEAVARNNYGEINSMWTKRPRGQLAKCAEAGGLRKAFPEELGGEYAAEEMEGRAIEDFELQGLPEPTHGASGIPAPEADAGNGQAADADDATDAGFDPDSDKTQMIPREVVEEAKAAVAKEQAAKPAKAEPKPKPAPAPKPAASNDEEALRRMDERNAAAKAAPAPQQEVAAGDWKVNLPEGAAKVLKANREAKNVTEAQLLAKMGADIVVGNINQALGLLKVWE